MAEAGVSFSQFGLMAEIASADDDTVSALAERMGLDQSTLSRTLRTLEADGLVEIAIVESDQRKRMVWLTEKGARRLEAALAAWRQAHAALARQVSRRRRPTLAREVDSAMKDLLDSRAAWITASAALAIMTIAYGAPLVVVVAMKQIAAELQTNRSGPAGAGSLSYVGAAFGGIVAGWLAGRLGIRPIVIFGSTMVAARPAALVARAACSSSMPATASSWACSAPPACSRRCSPMSACGSSAAAARRWR